MTRALDAADMKRTFLFKSVVPATDALKIRISECEKVFRSGDGVTDAVPDGLVGVSLIWMGTGGASNWDRPGWFP